MRRWRAPFTTGAGPLQSTVHAVIDTSSINTSQNDRDNHVRSEDFLHVEKHATITFDSTGFRPDGDDFLVDGNLTMKDVTRPVTLKLEINGFGPDAYGGTRAGFSAKGEINRSDFGISFNGVIPGTNGVVVSDKVSARPRGRGRPPAVTPETSPHGGVIVVALASTVAPPWPFAGARGRSCAGPRREPS